MIRRALPVLMTVLLGLGCGRSGRDTPLRVAAKHHPWLAAARERLQRDFEQTYHRPLHIVLLDTMEYDRQLKKTLVKTDAPAPAVIETDDPAAYLYLQTIIPLNKAVDGWDRARRHEWFGDFARLRTGSDGIIGGICVHRPEPLVLAVRGDWLEKQQLQLPATVEEMVAVIKSFTAPEKHIYGWAWTDDYCHLIMRAYNGVLVQNESGSGIGRAGFTGSVAEKELNILRQLSRMQALPPGLATPAVPDAAALFKANRVGLLITPLRRALALQAAMGDDRVALGGLPRGTVKPANGQASVWALTGLAEHDPDAWHFFEWWYRPETFAILCTPDSSGDTRNLPAWLNPFGPRTGSDPVTALLYGEKIEFNEHPFRRRISEVVCTYYHYAMTGSLDTRAALDAALEKTQKLHLLD